MIGQPVPPESLRFLQEEMGRAIRAPLSFAAGRLETRPETYPEAALAALRKGAGKGADRRGLESYNRQYWYRLFTVLQEEYPLLCACLGPWEFNRLASAYLSAHPSRHPTLTPLGDRLPDFLRSRPRYDKPWLHQTALLEAACHRAFHAGGGPALDPARLLPSEGGEGEDGGNLEGTRLALQPWLNLFEEDWNLVESRAVLLGAESTGAAPEDRSPGAAAAAAPGRPDITACKGHWAIGRDGEGHLFCRPLEAGAFRLLAALEAGLPLEAACERASADLDGEDREAFAEKVAGWFAEWTALGWLLHPAA